MKNDILSIKKGDDFYEKNQINNKTFIINKDQIILDLNDEIFGQEENIKK